MKKQIIIETDDVGANLYNVATQDLNIYAEYLEQLHDWNKMLDELIILQSTYNIDYRVDLKNLKILISLNSLLYRAIADLLLIQSALYISNIRLQQIFYIKHAYLIIYETFENLREQQSLLSQMVLEAGDVYLSSFKRWVKQKKSFFKDYKLETEIRTVRDKLAGHIVLDFKLWYETVLSLEPEYTMSIIINYMKLLEPLQSLTTDLVHFYKDIMATVNQELKEKNITMLDQLEALLRKVNAQQPEGNKLEIDLQSLRNFGIIP